MAERLQWDDDETWRSASKVLALDMLLGNIWQEMKAAVPLAREAFGLDADDEVSQEGLRSYREREEGGLSFVVNAIAMIGLDGDAVRAAAEFLSRGGDEATGAAHGGGGRH